MKTLIQAAVTILAASAAHAQQAVQWRVQDGGNGHWYSLDLAHRMNWPSARDWAESRGGYLATFHSAAEWDRIWTQFNGQDGYWIGFYQDPPTGLPPAEGWRWVTDEPVTFIAWASGEPNDWIGYRQWVCQAGNAAWDDTIPGGSQVPVIEWSADCNGDGIVDYGQCRDGTLPDYNGNNIPDCCEAGTPCIAENYPVEWRVADGGNGHWYQLSRSALRWTEARQHADELGGHLVTVSSPAEQAMVWSIASPAVLPSAFWIGGYQSVNACEPGCGWRWVTGETLTYTNWCGGCPNDNTVNGNEDAICVNSKNVWNDLTSNGQLPFVIEWSGDCNADGIVDYGQVLQGQLADTNADGIPDVCQQPTCANADIYRDFNVNGADLGILLSQWGPNTPLTESDLDRDGVVDGADLGLLLSFWGACP